MNPADSPGLTVAEALARYRSDRFPVVKTALIIAGAIGEFTVRMEITDQHADFACCPCVALDGQGDPEYDAAREPLTDLTPDPDRALAWASGWVKWDGCLEITIHEQERGPLHFCGRAAAARIGRLLDDLYDMAREIPAWEGD